MDRYFRCSSRTRPDNPGASGSRELSVVHWTPRASLLALVANEMSFLTYLAVLHISVLCAYTAETLRHVFLPSQLNRELPYTERHFTLSRFIEMQMPPKSSSLAKVA